MKIVLLVFLLVALGGCGNSYEYEADSELLDYAAFLQRLEARGIEFTERAQNRSSWFSVGDRVVNVGDEIINIYEFPTAEETLRNAEFVSHSGFSIGSAYRHTEISWTHIPRWYKQDLIIVRYVGEDLAIINALHDIFGETFAGNPTPSPSEIEAARLRFSQHSLMRHHWGVGVTGFRPIENAILVGIDPYTTEQKAIVREFLRENDFNTEHFVFEQAVTQEMLDTREARISAATSAVPTDAIVLVGEVSQRRTGITFYLENVTDSDFFYSSSWDIAVYNGGLWSPVPHLPVAGALLWLGELNILPAGYTKRFSINYDTFFGELPQGRYKFVRQIQQDWQTEENNFIHIEFSVEG